MIRMVLEVRHHEGKEDLFCPQVFCDHCGERITDSGNVLYLVKHGRPVNGEMFHTHKHCNRLFEYLEPPAEGERYYWEELNRIPAQLASNLGMVKDPWVRSHLLTRNDVERGRLRASAAVRDCITERLRALGDKLRAAHEAAQGLRWLRRSEGGDKGKEWKIFEQLDIALGDFENIHSFFNDWLGEADLQEKVTQQVQPTRRVIQGGVRTDPQRLFSERQRQELYLRSNGHCNGCGAPLDSDWHADHMLPHSRGGRTELINGQALCGPCNNRKRAKILIVDDEGGD